MDDAQLLEDQWVEESDGKRDFVSKAEVCLNEIRMHASSTGRIGVNRRFRNHH